MDALLLRLRWIESDRMPANLERTADTNLESFTGSKNLVGSPIGCVGMAFLGDGVGVRTNKMAGR